MKWPWRKEPVRAPAPRRTSIPRRSSQDLLGGAQDRLTADWSPYGVGINDALRNRLDPVRSRSRGLVRNNPYARRFVKAAIRNVIGADGISLVLPAGVEEPLKNAVLTAWDDWCLDACDITGRLSFIEMQQLSLSTVIGSGEVILVEYEGEGPFGLQYQMIDPVRLETGHSAELRNGNRIRMGIEIDALDRPVAYHFRNVEAGTETKLLPPFNYTRIPASRVLHLFVTDEVGQLRGLPWFHAAMYRLKMIGASDEASLVAQRLGASTMGIIESVAEVWGEGVGEDDTTELGEPVFEVEPGTFRELPAGKKLSKFDPAYPNAEHAPFTRAMLRSVAAGLDCSYSTLSTDLSDVNYGSLRQGALDDRDAWMVVQAFIGRRFVRRAFRKWITLQAIMGTIVVDGRVATFADLEPLRRATTQGRRWPWIDPLKDVKATQQEVASGFRSRSSVVRERGGDPRKVWLECAAENEFLDDNGLTFNDSGSAPVEAAKETEEERIALLTVTGTRQEEE